MSISRFSYQQPLWMSLKPEKTIFYNIRRNTELVGDGGKSRTANMVLKLPNRFLIVSSLQRTTSPLYRFFITVSSPSDLSLLRDKPTINNLSLPNSTSTDCTHLLHLLKLCKNTRHLKTLKSLLIVGGQIGDENLVGEFLRSCFDLGNPDLALSTFNTLENPRLYLQNLIVRCLCNHGLYEDVLCVYRKCRGLGCPSDNFTFPFVIKACSALGSLRMGSEVHCVVLRTGFEGNLVVQTALVDFYAKTSRMEIAQMLLDKIPKPDLVSWNALISGYSLNGLDEKVFEVFRKICAMGLKPNVSTLASVIPVCTRVGCIDTGKSLHGLAAKSGLLSDEYLIPALISMYAGDGDLLAARNLFDSICEKNVIICNAMISAYAQNQEHYEAFEIFQLMLDANMKQNTVSFVSIIPSCENLGSMRCGKSLHAFVIKNGFENQVSVATALVSMYAKFGDMFSSKFIFDLMPKRNLLSWNSMVSGCVHNELWGVSLATFCEMQVAGFDPDAVSIISILSACSKLEAIRQGKSAHAFSLKMGFDSNLNVSNALLAFYTDCCQLSSSFKIFNKMVLRNTISWNTLASGLVHIGETTNVISLLHQMQKEDVELDSVTIVNILPLCNKTKTLVQGMAVHGYAIKKGFVSNVSLVNALISMYFNSGDLDAGKLLFDAMTERSVVSWNALITGYRYHSQQNEVMVSFSLMIKEGQKPNYVTLLNLLPVCCTQLQGKSIHAHAVRTRILLETPLLTSLIFMYAKFENIRSCFLLFEMEEKADISLWNAIMSVHVQTRNAAKAVAFFSELLQTEMRPDYVTVLSLTSACTQLTSLNLTHSVMAYVIRKGFDNDVAVCNALIDSYARCGNISFARELFDGLVEKDSVSWSVMINGYGLHGDGEAALDLLSQMKISGVKPDSITYIGILSACSHAGLVEQGRMVFNTMVEQGIKPRVEHYACLVDLLGRMGHLYEAYDIVKGLPCKPTASLLESLLGACRVHGNIELGEEIGGLLYEIDPENPGLYVMLYNMYAAAGRWTDANSMRSHMERRQLRKVPGFSLVEENKHHNEELCRSVAVNEHQHE